MSDENTAEQTLEETPPAKAPTRYMVIWAPMPDDDGERKWREIGWYSAHSQEAAKMQARDDKESGHHAQIRDVAQLRGFQIRAIAKSSWPDDDEVHVMEQPPPDWGTKQLQSASKEGS